MKKGKRIELHCHTKMSMNLGLADVKKLIGRAKELGMPGIAITDYYSAQSFPAVQWYFEEERRKGVSDDSFKVVYGIEVNIIDDRILKTPTTDNYLLEMFRHQKSVILAKNQKGLYALYHLLSVCDVKYRSADFALFSIPASEIEPYKDCLLIGLTAEVLMDWYLAPYSRRWLEDRLDFYDYVEIEPTDNLMKYMYSRYDECNGREWIENANTELLRRMKKLGKLIIASSNVCYLNPADEAVHQLFPGQNDNAEFPGQKAKRYLMSEDEMMHEFSYLGKNLATEIVFDNPKFLFDQVEKVCPIVRNHSYPVLKNSDKNLKTICRKKLKDIYGANPPAEVKERFEKEVNGILSNGFDFFYMVEQKITSKCENDGFPYNQRGSCGSSFVAYLAGITLTNPLPPHYICPVCKHTEFANGKAKVGPDLPDKKCPACKKKMKKDGFHLATETFLGYRFDKEPDFDINVPREYQITAQKTLAGIKGIGTAVHAGTIRTRYEKEAYELAKEGFSEEERISKIVEMLCNTKTGEGIHPGGIIVVPEGESIEHYTPIRRIYGCALDFCSSFEYHDIDYSLPKIDILAHDDLSLIKKLEDETGKKRTAIPLKDRKMLSLFSSCEGLGITPDQIDEIPFGTLGVSEFGNAYVRNNVLPFVNVNSFFDIIQILGLCHGTNTWENNAEQLIKQDGISLSDCIAHRDDIMLYLISKGMDAETAFLIMEYVRKGRGARSGLKPEWKELMLSLNVPEWYIESCEKIRYLFPKSHSTGYAIVSWWLLYYKLYYPEVFYKAWFETKSQIIQQNTIPKNFKNIVKDYRKMKKQAQKGLLERWEMDYYNDIPLLMEMQARGIDPALLFEGWKADFLPH